MGHKRVRMELIKSEKNRLQTFKKRKANLLKKINEFCILCDVKACLILFTGDELETWAPQSCTVAELIQQYRTSDQPRRCYTVTDYFAEKKKRVDVELSKLRKKIYKMKFPTWDQKLDNFSADQLTAVLGQLDSKLKLADERIAALTSAERAAAGLAPPAPLNFQIQDVGFVAERELEKGYPSKLQICSDFTSPPHQLPSSSSDGQQSSAMGNCYSDNLYSNNSFYVPDRFNFFAPGVGEFTPFSPPLMPEFSPEKGVNFGLMQQYQQSNVPVMMQSPPMPQQESVMNNRGHHQGMLMPVNGGSQWIFDSAGMLGGNSDGGGGMGMGYISSSGFQQMQFQFSSPAMAAAGFSSHPRMYLNQVDESNISGFEFDRRDRQL